MLGSFLVVLRRPASRLSVRCVRSFECGALPAPGSPFHHAFPVHSLAAARAYVRTTHRHFESYVFPLQEDDTQKIVCRFYGGVLGCEEGRSSERKWIDFSLGGHQIVCHYVGDDYRCQDYFNPVDGDEVPVPHFGLALSVHEWKALTERLKGNVDFLIVSRPRRASFRRLSRRRRRYVSRACPASSTPASSRTPPATTSSSRP